MKIFNSLFRFPKATMETSQMLESGEAKSNQTTSDAIDVNAELEKFGVDPKSELGQAMTLAAQKGVPVEAATIHEMKEFIDNVDGSTEEKLETVEKSLDKGIGVSEKALRLMHTALHDPMLTEALQKEIMQLIQDDTPKSEVRQLLLQVAREMVSQEGQLPDVLTDAVQILSATLESAGIQVGELSQQELEKVLALLVKSGSEVLDISTLVEGDENNIKEETNNLTDAAFLKLIPLLEEDTKEPDMNSVSERFVEDAQQFLEGLEKQIGDLVDAVKTMERDDTATLETDPEIQKSDGEGEQPPMEIAVQDELDALFALIQDQSNTFLVREVTVKMAQVTDEFRDFKRQAVNTMSDVSKAIEQPQRMSPQEKVDQLNKVIDQVDKVLLKSDITLYTDMKSEKQLLQFSSDLAEARNLLQTGNQQEAKELLDHVINELDAMVFKPSKVKVMHVVSQKAMDEVMAVKNTSLVEGLAKEMAAFDETPKNGRVVLDYMRRMGLNEDSEIVEKLGLTKGFDQNEQKMETNMRQILSKLAEEFEERSRMVQASDKMMNHLTGQQLGNKLEAKAQTQNLFFNIPVVVQDEIKDLKLYVKSRKQDQKLDWENSSLYFAIHTKSYDEMGIRVTSVNRNVTITVLNDHEELKEAMEPLMEAFKSEIEDVGYKVGGVYYSRLTEVAGEDKIEEAVSDTQEVRPKIQENGIQNPAKKGFDVRI